jgi:Tfp pilus assembly protein PilX
MTKFEITKNNKKGFALLFAVLVSSLLLTIGLSIFNIALKELAISTASRQSIYAFYAADSGREYVLYRDIKEGNILVFDQSQSETYATSTITNDNFFAGL